MNTHSPLCCTPNVEHETNAATGGSYASDPHVPASEEGSHKIRGEIKGTQDYYLCSLNYNSIGENIFEKYAEHRISHKCRGTNVNYLS